MARDSMSKEERLFYDLVKEAVLTVTDEYGPGRYHRPGDGRLVDVTGQSLEKTLTVCVIRDAQDRIMKGAIDNDTALLAESYFLLYCALTKLIGSNPLDEDWAY